MSAETGDKTHRSTGRRQRRTATRAQTEMANRLGARPAPRGSRRRGALLRRLLAAGDWVALSPRSASPPPRTATTDVGDALLGGALQPRPGSWCVKLHGLYDNDHRRIRHSTLDELPSLVSASALGTLVLDGLLALSPVGAALGRAARSSSASAPCSASFVAARRCCASSGTG